MLRRRIGAKQVKLVYAKRSESGRTKWKPVPRKMQEAACISDAEILDLARQAMQIEEHYSAHYGAPTPMDVEWAKDGPDGELYIIQARPETVHAGAATGGIQAIPADRQCAG